MCGVLVSHTSIIKWTCECLHNPQHTYGVNLKSRMVKDWKNTYMAFQQKTYTNFDGISWLITKIHSFVRFNVFFVALIVCKLCNFFFVAYRIEKIVRFVERPFVQGMHANRNHEWIGWLYFHCSNNTNDSLSATIIQLTYSHTFYIYRWHSRQGSLYAPFFIAFWSDSNSSFARNIH